MLLSPDISVPSDIVGVRNYLYNLVIEGLRATTTRDARSIVRLFFSQIR